MEPRLEERTSMRDDGRQVVAAANISVDDVRQSTGLTQLIDKVPLPR
jgi:hypothetical protein